MTLSNVQIIQLAACHFCCARIGEPCTWHSGAEDAAAKHVAKESHIIRQHHAQKKSQKYLDLTD